MIARTSASTRGQRGPGRQPPSDPALGQLAQPAASIRSKRSTASRLAIAEPAQQPDVPRVLMCPSRRRRADRAGSRSRRAGTAARYAAFGRRTRERPSSPRARGPAASGPAVGSCAQAAGSGQGRVLVRRCIDPPLDRVGDLQPHRYWQRPKVEPVQARSRSPPATLHGRPAVARSSGCGEPGKARRPLRVQGASRERAGGRRGSGGPPPPSAIHARGPAGRPAPARGMRMAQAVLAAAPRRQHEATAQRAGLQPAPGQAARPAHAAASGRPASAPPAMVVLVHMPVSTAVRSQAGTMHDGPPMTGSAGQPGSPARRTPAAAASSRAASPSRAAAPASVRPQSPGRPFAWASRRPAATRARRASSMPRWL